MVSTRNTSRSNANPPRMQDPLGDADSRPPSTLEGMQGSTNEVEALCLTNQRLIGELEQLTRHMQRPREARQAQDGHNFPSHEGQHNLDIPRGAETEAKSSRACKTREKSIFLKNGKTVISVETRKFSRSRMMKRIASLNSSREI